MKFINKNWIWILAFFTISLFTLSNYDNAVNKVLINESDALQYQLAAVNLLKYGEFPSIEIHENLDQYKVYIQGQMGFGNQVFYDFIKNNPPANDLTKPPVYALTISSIYALFGINPIYVIYFNLLLISLVLVIQLKIAHKLLGYKGLIVGVFIAGAYYWVTIQDAHNFYPHFIVQLLITALVYLFIKNKNTKSESIQIGVLLGLLVLTNGNTLFIPFFYFLYIFYKIISTKSLNNSYLSIPVFLLMLVPWITFANIKLHQSKAERIENTEKIWQDVKFKIYPGNFVHDKYAPNKKDSTIISQCIRNMYAKFDADGFVIISKQPFGDEILGAHNEYSSDGNFHPEWRFLENSYYHSLPKDMGVGQKIASFYVNNPEYILKNISGKLLGTLNPLSFFYFLSGILFGLWGLSYVFDSRKVLLLACLSVLAYLFIPQEISIYLFLIGLLLGVIGIFKGSRKLLPLKLIYFSIVNSLIITLLFVGESRYIQISDGVILIAYIYLLSTLFTPIVSFLSSLWLKFKTLYREHLKAFRLPEIVLMSGYFIIGFFLSHTYLDSLNWQFFALYGGILLYISSVYMLNSYADYEIDHLNPRLEYLSTYSKNTYLVLTFLTLLLALTIAFFISTNLVILISFSFMLWVLYYVKPFRFKASAIAGTMIHFIAGISHFQIGYELGGEWCYLSIMISFFFATLLSLGHINHELIDQKADNEAGIKNTATSFSKQTILYAFYTLFALSQIYLVLLYKWNFIQRIDFIAFFYTPIIILFLIIKKGTLLKRPLFVQKLFRLLLLASALILLLAKLKPYSGF